MNKNCENLLPAVLNELDDASRISFMEHLKVCEDCSKEYIRMTSIWNSLYADVEEQEVPATLKGEVMEFVFNREEKRVLLKLKGWLGVVQRQFTPVTAGLFIAMAMLVFGLGMHNLQLKDDIDNRSALEPSMDILAVHPLKSTEDADAIGHIFVFQEGKEQKLVLHADSLPQLQGSEVFQLWLIKDGKRENAGTFKADEKGDAKLIYELAAGWTYDQAGITIEPNPYSTQPRGKKIAGSLTP